MAEQNTTLSDRTYYLAVDAEGRKKWYGSDPLGSAGPQDEVVIEDEILRFLGAGNMFTTAKVKFKAVLANETAPFTVDVPAGIRRGELIEVRDGEGNRIEFVNTQSPDGDFPFNGLVMSQDGTPVGARTYSGKGDCSDGVAGHSLFVVRKAVR